MVAGIGAILWGMNMAGSLGGKLSSAFTGSPGDKPMMLYIIGGICAALGAYRLIK